MQGSVDVEAQRGEQCGGHVERVLAELVDEWTQAVEQSLGIQGYKFWREGRLEAGQDGEGGLLHHDGQAEGAVGDHAEVVV